MTVSHNATRASASSISGVSPFLSEKIEKRRLDCLQVNPRNARTHSKKQVRQIARSIQRFGFINPVLVDGDNVVIAGHGRVSAAVSLGLTEVPTIRLDHLNKAERRAFVIADNRLAELARWDEEILAIELQELSVLDLDFDITLTGFETAEIDLLIEGLGAEDTDQDEVPILDPDASVVARIGDLWALGDHRLHCGDARDRRAYELVMAGCLARTVFTDPPFNVEIPGHVSGLGRNTHDNFAMASGEMTDDEFGDFLSRAMANMVEVSLDGALHFICMDWRHLLPLLAAGQAIYSELKNICVWDKGRGGMGSLFRSQHELVCVFKNGQAPHVNNVDLGRYGRNRTNLWAYPGVNALTDEGVEALAMHPTVKPTAMVADAILDCSNRGDIILDPFGGSGTTLIAAERTGRSARILEIEPRFIDVTIERWQRMTGAEARHTGTGQTFEQRRRSTAAMESSQPSPQIEKEAQANG
jgi:DNA modification methylase